MPVLLPTEIIRHCIYMIWNDFVDKYVNGDQTGVSSIKYVEFELTNSFKTPQLPNSGELRS